MNKVISIIIGILFSNLITAQTTTILDATFEQVLINLGLDSGVPDGLIPTANIDTLTELNVTGLLISDLTGIEDFTALSILICQSNIISNLNLTQNTGLIELNCGFNQLTNLDLTQNVSLTKLTCSFNQITDIDLSQNLALTFLDCHTGSFLKLDLSNNVALTYFSGLNNQLSCLNIKNGNNTNFTFFDASLNPSLSCIEVDSVSYSNTTWTNIDAGASFSTNCGACTVGINEYNFTNTILYPNPTTGNISIDLGEVKQNLKATLTNSLGQIVLSQQFKSADIINLNIDAPTGIYFLQLETASGETKTIKILKE